MLPRFSLRTFLIAIGISGVAFGCVAAWRESIISRAERHVRAMNGLELRPANPVVRTKDKYPGYVNFVRTWIHPRAYEEHDRLCAPRNYWTPQHLALLKDLNGLGDVACSFEKFAQRDAEAIRAISELRRLSISFKQSEPGAIDTIAAIPQLEALSIFGEVDHRFFDAIASHKNLKILRLDKTKAPPSSAALASICNLAELHATSTIFDSTIFPAIAKTKVEKLGIKLQHCDVEALETLEQSSVRELVLFCPTFDAGTLEAVSQIPKLEQLSLHGTLEIRSGDFEALKACQQLKELVLPGLFVTADQWRILTSLPQLKVVYARELEGAEEARQRFRDSKPGRDIRSP